MRALIDTCVIIDALQEREGFAENARNIFLSCANNRFIGCVSAKALTDIYYVMRKFSRSEADARSVIGKLATLFEIVDTQSIDLKKAIPSPAPDFEDAVMIETAARCELDAIITRNVSHFAPSPVAVLTPARFLDLLSSNAP